MTEVKVLAICSLGLEQPQRLASFMLKVGQLSSAVEKILSRLKLHSVIEVRPELDDMNRFGLSVWLSESNQLSLTKELDPPDSPGILDREAEIVLACVQGLLAQVNRRFGGIPLSNLFSDDTRHLSLSAGEILRISRQLAPDRDEAHVRDSSGAVASANHLKVGSRLFSNEPQEFLALPKMVGRDVVDLHLRRTWGPELPLSRLQAVGTWMPMLHPDFKERLWTAMNEARWLRVSCFVLLQPSGEVKGLDIRALQEC